MSHIREVSKHSTAMEDEVALAVVLPFEEVRHVAFLLSHTAVLLALLVLTSGHF